MLFLKQLLLILWSANLSTQNLKSFEHVLYSFKISCNAIKHPLQLKLVQISSYTKRETYPQSTIKGCFKY